MINYLDLTMNSMSEKLVCSICSLELSSRFTLERHLLHVHNKTIFDHNVAVKSSDHSCPICFDLFNDINTLQCHTELHFLDDNQLPTCSGVAEDTENDFDFASVALAKQLEAEERQQLVQLDEGAEFLRLQEEYGMTNSTECFRDQYLNSLEKANTRGKMSLAQMNFEKNRLLLLESKGYEDDGYCVRGLLEQLRRFSAKDCDIYLASFDVTHFSTSRGDSGWGCGYRNIQMVLSALRNYPTISNVLFGTLKAIPSVPKLQQLITEAWTKGFDQLGKEQLGGKLVGTKRWIGATEFASFLQSLWVRVEIVEFHNKSINSMFEWILRYFQANDNTNKFPLYFQHQGHSRTIVGIEQHRMTSLTQLVIFDPGHWRSKMIKLTKSTDSKDFNLLKKSIGDFKHDKYQLINVKGIISDQLEYDRLKQQFDFVKITS